MHWLRACTNKFCDSYDWDCKEDISDAEQLPVSFIEIEMTHQQSFIKHFTGADVYKSDLIAYLTHFCTDLTHFHLRSHSY